MSRRAQAIVMFMLGGVLLRISFTDAYLRYVKAGLQPLLIATGVVLIAAAAMTLWYQWRQDPAHTDAADSPHDEHQHGHHGHDHGGEPRIAWLLLAPVFALVLIAPPALGADAAGRTGTALQQPVSDFPPLPDDDPLPLTMLDYASRAVFDQGRSLTDRTVTLRGFVLEGDSGDLFLARMVLSCCAADARPIKIGLSGAVPPGLAPDTWLEVTGHYTAKTTEDEVNHATIPYLDVDQAREIPPPAEQYES
jgi:uncharacterized repeat protein (TIGR03943 family)